MSLPARTPSQKCGGSIRHLGVLAGKDINGYFMACDVNIGAFNNTNFFFSISKKNNFWREGCLFLKYLLNSKQAALGLITEFFSFPTVQKTYSTWVKILNVEFDLNLLFFFLFSFFFFFFPQTFSFIRSICLVHFCVKKISFLFPFLCLCFWNGSHAISL